MSDTSQPTTRQKSRREILKLLAVAGFSVYLPSCWEQEKPTKIVPAKAPLEKDTVKVMESVLDADNVVFLKKGDEDFDQFKNGFNLRVQKEPALIALCKNTEGVVSSVNFARQNNLKIAIRSGGHSFESFSSSEGGMLINLSLMNKVEWLPDNAVNVEPACLLRDLYDELLPKNRIIPAGSCGTVGVGGLSLGGGYGFFARKYGLTCDSMIEATMVDGLGKVHHAKAEDELLWALRGGGNGNFGIITQMKFKTHPAPAGFTRYRFKARKLNVQRARELLEMWFDQSSRLPESCFSAFVLNGKTLTTLITNFEDGTKDLKEMIQVHEEKMDESSIGKRRELAKSLKTYYGVQHPIYFKNSSAGYYNDFSSISSFIDQVLEIVINTPGVIYQINTLGGNIADPEFENASSYPHRHLPYLSELQTYWEEGRNPSRLTKAFADIQKIFFDNGVREQYRNYPSMEFESWETAYYGETNYPKLQQIKKKYDPDNTISHPQSIKT